MSYRKTYLSRADSRKWAVDNPVGDPFGGPAYGEKTDIATAIGAGASILGGIFGSESQSDAAESAASAQSGAAAAGIAEQRRQFNEIQKLLSPYVNAGTSSLGSQLDLLGLKGNKAQQTAIANLQNSSQFNALANQGENAILQNASATGGLRGGNAQAALAQFRPQLLNQLINQQYSRLSGLSSLGANSVTGLSGFGQNTSNAISALLQQQGAAQAGNALAQGSADANLYSGLAKSIGTIAGAF